MYHQMKQQGGGNQQFSQTVPAGGLPSIGFSPRQQDTNPAFDKSMFRNKYSEVSGTTALPMRETMQFDQYHSFQLNIKETPWDPNQCCYRFAELPDPDIPLKEQLAVAEMNVQRLSKRLEDYLQVERQFQMCATTVDHLRREIDNLTQKLIVVEDENAVLRTFTNRNDQEMAELRHNCNAYLVDMKDMKDKVDETKEIEATLHRKALVCACCLLVSSC